MTIEWPETASRVGMELETRRRQQQRPHRVVPVSLAYQDGHGDGPGWRCSACGARRAHPDDFYRFECVAVPMEGLA